MRSSIAAPVGGRSGTVALRQFAHSHVHASCAGSRTRRQPCPPLYSALDAGSPQASTTVSAPPAETSPAAPVPAAPATPSASSAPAPSAAKGNVLVLRSAACYLPHPDKVSYGGEDAHFVSNVGGGAVGVADGVGGWQAEGVNPAEYSATLMRFACEYLERALVLQPDEAARVAKISSNDASTGAQEALVDPRGAIDAAHRRTRCAGSSTVCIVQLDQEKKQLVAANLGDSGFLVIRGGAIVARSRPLEHIFDCPLQLGCCPEFTDATDNASMAEVYKVPVRPGDVIVAGSDGLFDNTFDSEVIATCAGTQNEVGAAIALAKLAREHASDPLFESPYTREALKQGFDIPWGKKLAGMRFIGGKVELAKLTGGKQDDITVLVVRVVEEGEE